MKRVADSSFLDYGTWYLEREERKGGRLDHPFPTDEGAMQLLFKTKRYEGKYRDWFPRGSWSICYLTDDEELDDEHNPEMAFHLVQAIYHEASAHGLAEHDIVADYTGGTKSMTAGMVLACSVSEDRNAQYMKPRQVEPTGVATPAAGAVPILVDLRFGAKG